MKPLRLSFQAFGPYLDKIELDFTGLFQDGLFLITGPTGGGKTSLLDAMSFALYCRSTGGRRDFSGMRCASAPEEIPTFVEFDFSLQGKTYRFRREQRMHRNRNTKALETRETHACYVQKGNDMELLLSGSEKAVREQAEQLLHLTCEQFSQVIVLPQGDFLRLLRANSKEKAAMLETLFSSGMWRKITDRFTARAKTLEKEMQRLRTMRDSLLSQEGVETAEALSTLISEEETALQDLDKKAKTVKEQLEKAEISLAKAQTYHQLLTAKTKAEAQLKRFEQEYDKLENTRSQQEEKQGLAQKYREESLQYAREAAGLKGKLEEILRRQERIQSLEKEIAKTKAEAEKAAAAKAAISERLQIGKDFLDKAQKQADQLPAFLTQKQNLEKSLSLFQQWQEAAALVQAEEKKTEADRAVLEKSSVQAAALTAALQQQEEILRSNAALLLAQSLKPEQPCPVCGSLHHPNPAMGTASLLDANKLELLRQEEKTAKESLLRRQAAFQTQQETLNKAKEAAGLLESACKETGISLDDCKKQLEFVDKQLQVCQNASAKLEPARKKLALLQQEYDTAQQQETAASAFLTKALAALQEAQQADAAEKEDALSPAALSKAVQEKQQACQTAEAMEKKLTAEYQAFLAAYSAAAANRESGRQQYREAAEAFAPVESAWEAPPVLEPLEQAMVSLKEQAHALWEERGKKSARLLNLQKIAQSVSQLSKDFADVDKSYTQCARISQSLAGQNALRTPILQYVLSIMLDQVLVSANHFFSTLSRGRYALQRMDGPKSGRGLSGLDIEVVDGTSMLPRSIETLSGGEQFLASLALAFGLSDVVQNQSGAVHLDALFIDEGFGSLDGETLDTAMKALAMIRSSGRLIGIISHVSELRGRIGTRIEITRNSQGFSQAAVKQSQ
jgi:exonuclease SbcC